jgi:endoglucanase
VATTAVAVGRLLDLYERYPKSFSKLNLRIPESGNGIPDLLDEARIGLDWMLKLQRQDGAIYRKIGGAACLLFDWDDRLWAAVELSISTRQRKWDSYIEARLPLAPVRIFECKDPASLALVHYALHSGSRANPTLRNGVVAAILSHAANLLTQVDGNIYRLANQRFVWGSNRMTVEEAIILLDAYAITADIRYRYAALDQIHYIFGRNHFGKSFVTGVGAQPVLHVSHLFARAAGINIPGLLLGGPNELEQSGIAPRLAGPLSYADDARSYATNEYAIDYDASLISLIVTAMNGQ